MVVRLYSTEYWKFEYSCIHLENWDLIIHTHTQKMYIEIRTCEILAMEVLSRTKDKRCISQWLLQDPLLP